MTPSLWGPDGQWVGGAPPTPDRPLPAPETERTPLRWVGTGFLAAVGVALLLPALLLALIAVISGVSGESRTAVATVTAVEPGADPDGRRPACYTVAYDVDGRTWTHRTCDTSLAPRSVSRPSGEVEPETPAEQARRFAAEHPVGSQVEVLYDVDDPSSASGPVAELGSGFSGGSPTLTAVLAGLALALLTGALLAFRAAWRVAR